jgi:CBS domain-containing protein
LNGGKLTKDTVRDILTSKGNTVWFTLPAASVFDALRVLADRDIGALVVIDNDRLVGIFSERDYARKVVLQGKVSRQTTVSEAMTAPVMTVGPEKTIDECMRLMTDRHIRHLPVMQYGALIGVISIGDVVKSIIADQQSTIGHLEDYIVGRR